MYLLMLSYDAMTILYVVIRRYKARWSPENSDLCQDRAAGSTQVGRKILVGGT